MTRYYVDMSTELLNTEGLVFPDGWRLIERWGPRTEHTERWLAEDDEADPGLEDRLVELTFKQTENGPAIAGRYPVKQIPPLG